MQNTSPLMPATAKVAAVSHCLGLWFFPLRWPPLPVVVISRLFPPAASYCHPSPKQMAWNEISIWCGKTQIDTGGQQGNLTWFVHAGPEFSKPDSNLSWLWPHNGGFWLSIPQINLTTVEEGRGSWFYSPPHFALSLLPLEQKHFLQCSFRSGVCCTTSSLIKILRHVTYLCISPYLGDGWDIDGKRFI